MADVVDIIHNLSFNADSSIIEALTKEFGRQFDQIVALQKEIDGYEQSLSGLAKDDIKNRQAINGLIETQKAKINEVTTSIGKQFAANDKLVKSFSETDGKLKSLTQAGTQFAASKPTE